MEVLSTSTSVSLSSELFAVVHIFRPVPAPSFQSRQRLEQDCDTPSSLHSLVTVVSWNPSSQLSCRMLGPCTSVVLCRIMGPRTAVLYCRMLGPTSLVLHRIMGPASLFYLAECWGPAPLLYLAECRGPTSLVLRRIMGPHTAVLSCRMLGPSTSALSLQNVEAPTSQLCPGIQHLTCVTKCSGFGLTTWLGHAEYSGPAPELCLVT